MKFTLEEIITASGADVLRCDKDRDFNTKISTDTRTISEGDFYLPLKGESFDGENFLENAIGSGAIGCFVTKDTFPESAEVVLKVQDTKSAYLKIASFVRDKYNPKTIAITGSSGKTTTKEMVSAVCSSVFKTHKTFSNHNNEVGFCQTVLSMPEDTEVLIVEMGMRGLGEIELLSRCAKPDYAIITNVGSAHIGRLGSLDNIAVAKAEIVAGLKDCGCLVANDSERLRKFVEFDGEKVFYSMWGVKVLEKRPHYSKFQYKNRAYELNVEGDYNIENSIAAIEVGYRLGMFYEEIRDGLLNYKPIEKRWEQQKVNGYTIINDSYNANPDSMLASVSTFIDLYEKPVVVLGNMGELGDLEVELHRQVGYALSCLNPRGVLFLTVGNLAKEIAQALDTNAYKAKCFDTNEEVSRYILENVDVDTTIFLKASRSMKFEEIISNIKGEDKL